MAGPGLGVSHAVVTGRLARKPAARAASSEQKMRSPVRVLILASSSALRWPKELKLGAARPRTVPPPAFIAREDIGVVNDNDTECRPAALSPSRFFRASFGSMAARPTAMRASRPDQRAVSVNNTRRARHPLLPSFVKRGLPEVR